MKTLKHLYCMAIAMLLVMPCLDSNAKTKKTDREFWCDAAYEMAAPVLKNMSDGRNYNKEGYLTLGFNGSQPEISDVYTNNGSLYLASFIFLPLGLPADAPFWTDEPLPWTSKKAWEGGSFPKDHAYHENR